MSRPNIVHKEEQRFLYKDPTKDPQDPSAIVFGILEMKLETPTPLTGPCLFQVVVNAQLVTRKQLEGIRDCISDALDGVAEGRIIPVPPGTRIGNPNG